MADPAADLPPPPEEEVSFLAGLVAELTSPINVLLIVVCGFLVYRILKLRSDDGEGEKNAAVDSTPRLPKMRKRDFTVDELKEFDGVKNTDGRILIAVNGKVLDVSAGRKLYGPG
jgi:membrane-associated progesterone receptor component